MKEEHRLARSERIGIMCESGATEDEANEYCNTIPDMYGYIEWRQEELIPTAAPRHDF